MLGAGCPPKDLISPRLSSPCYGGPRVRIHLPPAERCYGAGGEEMAPSSLRQPMECPDAPAKRPPPAPGQALSRSLVSLDQDSTIIAVVEMSQSSWLVAGMLPGI